MHKSDILSTDFPSGGAWLFQDSIRTYPYVRKDFRCYDYELDYFLLKAWEGDHHLQQLHE